MSAEKSSGKRRLKKWRRRRSRRRVFVLVLALVGIAVVGAGGFLAIDKRTPRDSLNKALAFRQHGEFSASIIELKSALQSDPKNAQLRISLGQTYLQVNDLASAEKEFQRAQSAGASPREILLPLARTWLLQKKYGQVLDEVLLEGLEGEMRADTLVARGRAHAGLDQLSMARDSFDQALEINRQHVGAWLEITRVAIGENRMAEANQGLEVLQELAPKNLEVGALRGDLFLKTGHYADAVTQYRKVVGRLPGHILTNVALAQALHEQGLDDESVKVLDGALQQDRGNYAANILRATIAFENSDYPLALEHAERALETDSQDLRTLIFAGSVAFELGQLELAQLMLDKAVAHDPKNEVAHRLLSTIREQRALREWDQTLAQLIDDSTATSSVAVAVDPAARKRQILDAGLAYLAARRHSLATAVDEENARTLAGVVEIFNTENAEPAIKLLEFVLREHSGSKQVRNLLAEAYLRHGKGEEAYLLIEPELVHQTGSRPVMILAAMAGLITNRPDRARLALKNLDDLDPRAVEVHYLLALAYSDLDNRRAYLDSLEQAVAIDHEYAPAISERTRSALSDQRLEEAEEDTRRLQALWPDQPEYYDAAAGAALLRGRASEAARLYRNAFDIQPTTIRALRLAYAEHRSGRVCESQAVLTRWLGAHPGDTEVALVLANKHLSAGALVDASEVYAIVLRQQPDHIVAMNNLAWVSLQLGENEIALKLAKRGLELSPDNTPLMDTLAEIYLSNGEYAEALPLLQRAVRSANAGPSLQIKLARTLAQTGNHSEARDLLRQTLAAYSDFPDRDEAVRLSAQLTPQ